MRHRTLGIIMLLLATLLLALQTLKAEALDEIKVIGIGLGAGNVEEAGNYASIGWAEALRSEARHASEILNRLPGLNIQHGSGQEHLTAIRSPVLTGGAGAGSFLYLEDGVSLRAPGFANVNGLFEASPELSETIDVVRGPGSALYGSNAVHGVVNFKSRAPQAKQQGDVSLRFGLNPFSVKSILSETQPLGKNAALRIGFAQLFDRGWRDSTGVEQYKGQIRIDNHAGNRKFKTLVSGHYLDQQTGSYLENRDNLPKDIYKYRALTFTNEDPNAYRRAYAVRGQNQTLWSINQSQQLNLTSWVRWTNMNFLMHFLPGQPVEKNAHLSFGARPIWQWQIQKFGNFNLNFGTEIEWTRGTLNQTQTNELKCFGRTSSPPCNKEEDESRKGTHYDYRINALTIALFTQNSYLLPDGRTNIHFGFRSEWTKYDYNNVLDASALENFGRFTRPADRIDTFWTITPKIGINYRLPKLGNHQIYLFTNYTRGARAPQTTDLYRLQKGQPPGNIKPERLDSVELGFRGKQKALTWELVGFYMNKTHYHFRDSNSITITNGKTRHAGLELQFYAPLIWGLSWKTAFSYARHWYVFNYMPDTILPPDRIQYGNAVDTAPRTLLNTEITYTHNRGTIALELIYVGKYYTDPANLHNYPGHTILNARSTLHMWGKSYLFFDVFNLLDTRYADRADYAFGNKRYFPGQPRAYYLGIRTNY